MKLSDFPIKTIASNIRDKGLQQGLRDNGAAYEIADGTGIEGDIVLCRVMDDFGAYDHLENIWGRSGKLYKNDYIIGVLGNRFSGQNLFGHWEPASMAGLTINLLTNGGIVGLCDDSPAYKGAALRLEPIGLIYKDGKKINIADNYGGWDEKLEISIPLIFVCGTSGETGKTTVTKDIIRHMKRKSNKKVAGVKIAGTGCMEDILEMQDAGSDYVGDLSDVGLASTYCDYDKVRLAINTLLNNVGKNECDICVCELGGDIIGGNVWNIIQEKDLMQRVSTIVLTYFDIMGLMGIKNIFDSYSIKNDIVVAHCINRNITASNRRIRDWGLYQDAYDMNTEDGKARLVDRILAKL